MDPRDLVLPKSQANIQTPTFEQPLSGVEKYPLNNFERDVPSVPSIDAFQYPESNEAVRMPLLQIKPMTVYTNCIVQSFGQLKATKH